MAVGYGRNIWTETDMGLYQSDISPTLHIGFPIVHSLVIFQQDYSLTIYAETELV
jgi:hypothetical protein